MISDYELIQALLRRKIFKNRAELSRFAGYCSASQIYRILKGQSKMGGAARKKLEEKLQQSQQPAATFAPKIIDESQDRKWLILDTETGAEMRIPLSLKDGKWIVNAPAFDITWKNH